MAYNFVIDTDACETLKGNLIDKADDLCANRDAITSGINNIGNSWSGDNYEVFKRNYESLLPSLESVEELVRAYANCVESSIEYIDTAIEAVKKYLDLN